MKLERTRDAAGPIIKGIGPAGFRTDDGTFPALMMTVDSVAAWSPPPLADLTADDLAPLVAVAPEFILLGTGDDLSRPPRALVTWLEERGIGIEPMDSRAAARTWGVLRGEGRQIAAALYPLD
ncbi:MAG: Mth938-like domain-containing protein [Candidatus Sphingomonas colombiensis]|nr:Mth938-like domain-containing protein [Sphingomonas sp.]WEK42721.1 MAG: Mth938-like domain-containing protein [Sphingomonas sp.]